MHHWQSCAAQVQGHKQEILLLATGAKGQQGRGVPQEGMEEVRKGGGVVLMMVHNLII